MDHLEKRNSAIKELHDLSKELKDIEAKIKRFRVKDDGDEKSLQDLKDRWRDCVLRINISVQGRHPSEELSDA